MGGEGVLAEEIDVENRNKIKKIENRVDLENRQDEERKEHEGQENRLLPIVFEMKFTDYYDYLELFKT